MSQWCCHFMDLVKMTHKFSLIFLGKNCLTLVLLVSYFGRFVIKNDSKNKLVTEKHFQMSMQPEFGQKNSGLLKQEVAQKSMHMTGSSYQSFYLPNKLSPTSLWSSNSS